MPLFTLVRGRRQPVEKVGAELKMTTNRAPEAPKSPKYGAFGARSGAEAGIEGVFQQAGVSLQHQLGSFVAGPGRSSSPNTRRMRCHKPCCTHSSWRR